MKTRTALVIAAIAAAGMVAARSQWFPGEMFDRAAWQDQVRIAEGGRSLSGGQKQAIGLARILIRKPRILFLDEPTAHYDVRSETEFLERLRTMSKSDMTIIVSTHRPSLLALVDRLLWIERGRVVADGPRDQVLASIRNTVAGNPADAAAARKPHAAI